MGIEWLLFWFMLLQFDCVSFGAPIIYHPDLRRTWRTEALGVPNTGMEDRGVSSVVDSTSFLTRYTSRPLFPCPSGSQNVLSPLTIYQSLVCTLSSVE